MCRQAVYVLLGAEGSMMGLSCCQREKQQQQQLAGAGAAAAKVGSS
jgi:hypothetical protein